MTMSSLDGATQRSVDYSPQPPLHPDQSRSERKMLDLPRPGDRVARLWISLGFLAYLVLAVLFVATLQYADRTAFASKEALLVLFGLGHPKNLAVLVLVMGGVGLTLAAFWRLFFTDLRDLAKEEEDLDWVQRTGRPGLPFVFVDAKLRDEALAKDGENFFRNDPASLQEKRSVETLTDDRVRRVQVAALSGGRSTVSTEELRIVAERRTARFGAFARYASSLLLLLAVLGTFAGVKTALPGLMQALGRTASDTNALVAPLQAIAAAFGGNALALVGAIAVGVAAQGVSFGRQHLLERLELLSSEHIYGDSTISSSDPLQAAIQALRQTAAEFQASTGVMSGIEGQLQSLADEFRTSFVTLADRLTDLSNRNQDELYDKNAAALDRLQRQVAGLASSVEGNAQTYAGLVSSIRDRAEETRGAIGEMRNTNGQLTKAIDAFVSVGDKAERTFTGAQQSFEVMNGAAERLASVDEVVSKQIESIARSVESIGSRIETLDQTFSRTADSIAQVDRGMRESWSEFSTALLERMDTEAAQTRAARATLPATSIAPPARAGDLGAPETVTLLRQIAAGVKAMQAPRAPSIWRSMLAPAAGVLAGGVVVIGIVALLLR